MSPVFQSWQNQNRYRAYPFRESSNLSLVEDPDISIPYGFIIDFAISVPITVQTDGDVQPKFAEVQLSSILYGGSLATLFFSNGDGEAIATASIPDLDSHVQGAAYPVVGSGDWEDVRGSVVLGDLTEFRDKIPQGAYTFSGAFFEIATVRPVLRGVRSIRTGTGTVETSPLHGHVKLIEGSNVKLSVVTEQNAIRIDAVRNDGFEDAAACAETNSKSVVKTINGVSTERVRLVGDGCVKVTVSGNVVHISDTCSQPCCGCEEMDAIVERLKMYETAITHIEALASTLEAVVPTSVSAAKVAVATHGSMETSNIDIRN